MSVRDEAEGRGIEHQTPLHREEPEIEALGNEPPDALRRAQHHHLTSYKAVTIPVQIAKMIDLYNVLWGPLSAAVVIQLVPVPIVVFLIQRHTIRGLALGAVTQAGRDDASGAPKEQALTG